MFVKICGITRLGDADAAIEAGANALGFVFWPGSPRFVDPYRARAIVAGLPPFVTAVGLFVNQPPAYVNGVVSLVGLGAVQLHGDETPADAALVRRPLVKAIALAGAIDDRLNAWPAHVTMLLDTDDRERRGGTGQTIDWAAAAAVAARRRTILAGGLTPENVAAAVARVRPFGIDVSSSIERAPGLKDHSRIRALFSALNTLPAAKGL
jgi:phosphoribosylanthranilate isomerase